MHKASRSRWTTGLTRMLFGILLLTVLGGIGMLVVV